MKMNSFDLRKKSSEVNWSHYFIYITVTANQTVINLILECPSGVVLIELDIHALDFIHFIHFIQTSIFFQCFF